MYDIIALGAYMSFLKKLTSFISGLRKWTIMVLILVVGISFRIAELITGAEFVVLIKGVAIAFMSSNAVEHAKQIFTKTPDKKEDMSKD